MNMFQNKFSNNIIIPVVPVVNINDKKSNNDNRKYVNKYKSNNCFKELFDREMEKYK